MFGARLSVVVDYPCSSEIGAFLTDGDGIPLARTFTSFDVVAKIQQVGALALRFWGGHSRRNFDLRNGVLSFIATNAHEAGVGLYASVERSQF